MSTASLHFHQPHEYTVKGGLHMDVSRIMLVDEEHPARHEITVTGVLYEPGAGPVARILVIHLEKPVDVTQNLAETVRELLVAGDYQVV